MATDYDAPRKNDDDVAEDSIEELILVRLMSTRMKMRPQRILSFPEQIFRRKS